MSTRWDWLYRAFSHDFTAAILVVFQTSFVRAEPSSYVKTFFGSNKFVQLQVTQSHVIQTSVNYFGRGFSCNLVPRDIFYSSPGVKERAGKRRGPWEQSWFSWCPYYRGVSDIQRGSLGESWLKICRLKSDLMLTVMSFVSVRVLITPDSKCFTAVSVRTDGAELKKRKLINKDPSQVEVRTFRLSHPENYHEKGNVLKTGT